MKRPITKLDPRLAAVLGKPERRAVRGAPPPGLITPTSPTHLKRVTSAAIAAHSMGEKLLAQARKHENLTLATVATLADLTPGRIAQIESPDARLEVQTVLRVARALGHGVRVALIPSDPARSPLVADLLEPKSIARKVPRKAGNARGT